MPGLSCMNRWSCFATSVPSAPRAEPENVRTVSCLLEGRAQAVRNPARAIGSKVDRTSLTRCQTGKEGRAPPRLTCTEISRSRPVDLANRLRVSASPPRGYNLACARTVSRDPSATRPFAETQPHDSPGADRLHPHARVLRGRPHGRLDAEAIHPHEYRLLPLRPLHSIVGRGPCVHFGQPRRPGGNRRGTVSYTHLKL